MGDRTNPEQRKIIKEAKALGFDHSYTTKGHLCFKHPNGAMAIVSPRLPRSVYATSMAQLRNVLKAKICADKT